jgi:hypothetical protein
LPLLDLERRETTIMHRDEDAFQHHNPSAYIEVDDGLNLWSFEPLSLIENIDRLERCGIPLSDLQVALDFNRQVAVVAMAFADWVTVLGMIELAKSRHEPTSTKSAFARPWPLNRRSARSC